ncbi:MAG: MBL fold metallo-hydrolase [Dehalococcoidia bacterium]
MCDDHRGLVQITRRTWLRRASAGVMAIATALTLERGQQGLSIAIGRPTEAEELPLQFYRAVAELNFGGTGGIAAGFDVQSHVLVRGREATIVDTLTAGNVGLIGAALASAGLSFADVVNVVLTHMHGDHTGNLNAVLDAAPRATVFAGVEDLPRIASNRPIRPAREGDEIFGVRVIETPGHTPGHISLFDPASGTLILGDALSNRGGQLSVLAPADSTVQAFASLARVSTLPASRALLGHGFPIERNVSTVLADFASQQAIARVMDRAKNAR